VRVRTHTTPVAIARGISGELEGLTVARTGSDGKPIAGTEQPLACDLVLVAIGQAKLRELATQFPGVALDARGCVVADAKTGATGNPKVYSGGDCVNGGKEVVNAVADGRNAARHLSAMWAGKK
jgi:glutamate synthase (NADPH/NADH) small chain